MLICRSIITGVFEMTRQGGEQISEDQIPRMEGSLAGSIKRFTFL